MDESTFETFEEELGTPLQDVPPQKSFRQARRTEMYTQRRVREEAPIVQQIPKAVPLETTVPRATSLRKTLSLQNVAQIEVPWEGVTLNRCLFIAITILVLTSGCQRLNEVVRGRKDGTDVDGIGTALNVRHTGMRKGRLPPPEPETSLWETFFWWVSDDDEEVGRRGRTRKATQEKSSRGLRHKATPNRNLLKGRQDRFKARRGKARQDEEELKERVKGQRVKEKRLTQKKLEKKEQGKKKEEEEKMQKKKNAKESKKKDTKV